MYGRPELNDGNPAAFIKRTDQAGITQQIWTYYLFKEKHPPFKELSEDEIDILVGYDENQKRNDRIYIFWLQ